MKLKVALILIGLFLYGGAMFHSGMVWEEHKISSVMFDDNLRITIDQGETILGLKTLHIQIVPQEGQ